MLPENQNLLVKNKATSNKKQGHLRKKIEGETWEA